MQQLTNILEQATGAIGEQYFHLAIYGGDPIFRERVYCYELYHQLRARWPNPCPLVLSGEVSKQGHEVLRNLGARAAAPDMLVHDPGTMNNHAIIEVKPANGRDSGIEKDIITLSQFRELVGYERAIYLFYGGIDENLVRTIASRVGPTLPIELWLHEQHGQNARQIGQIP